jgi:hypothetical protein
MGYLLTITTCVLAISFGLILYLRRGKRDLGKDEVTRIKAEINGLLTDFNRISNANINVLEERIRCLEELIELADDKIERLNRAVVDTEIVINRRSRPIITKEVSIPKAKITREYERIKHLSTRERSEAIELEEGEGSTP